MKLKSMIWTAVGCLAGYIGLSTVLYTVDETEQVVITRMGDPVRTVKDAGLHAKWPWPVESTNYFDERLLEYEDEPESIPTKDKKFIVIDNYGRWRITDPLKFMQAVVNENGAQSRLDDIIYSSLRERVSDNNLTEIVKTTNRKIITQV